MRKLQGWFDTDSSVTFSAHCLGVPVALLSSSSLISVCGWLRSRETGSCGPAHSCYIRSLPKPMYEMYVPLFPPPPSHSFLLPCRSTSFSPLPHSPKSDLPSLAPSLPPISRFIFSLLPSPLFRLAIDNLRYLYFFQEEYFAAVVTLQTRLTFQPSHLVFSESTPFRASVASLQRYLIIMNSVVATPPVPPHFHESARLSPSRSSKLSYLLCFGWEIPKKKNLKFGLEIFPPPKLLILSPHPSTAN